MAEPAEVGSTHNRFQPVFTWDERGFQSLAVLREKQVDPVCFSALPVSCRLRRTLPRRCKWSKFRTVYGWVVSGGQTRPLRAGKPAQERCGSPNESHFQGFSLPCSRLVRRPGLLPGRTSGDVLSGGTDRENGAKGASSFSRESQDLRGSGDAKARLPQTVK